MALTGIIKAAGYYLGDHPSGGEEWMIAYIQEQSKYIKVGNRISTFELVEGNTKIKLTNDFILENNTGSTITVKRLAVIYWVGNLDNITDIKSTPYEIFPEQLVDITIENGQMVNFKGATLQITPN